MGQTIFVIVWLIFASFILYGTLTHKGQAFRIRVLYGAKVVEDLGKIGQNKVLLGKQKLSLLKCRANDSEFYVLETKTISGPGFRYSSIKINDDTLWKIVSLANIK
jgi:hypothetical protein